MLQDQYSDSQAAANTLIKQSMNGIKRLCLCVKAAGEQFEDKLSLAFILGSFYRQNMKLY